MTVFLAGASTACGLFFACTVYLQLFRMWRSQTAAGVSLTFVVAAFLSYSSWLGYGVALGNTPLILANGLAWPGAISVVALAVRLRGR